MNPWMAKSRQRVGVVCLAILIGIVALSGCSLNRSAEGKLPSWTRVSRANDTISTVQSPPALPPAYSQLESVAAQPSVPSVQTAYPPPQFASRPSPHPEPQIALQPPALPVEVAKIEPRRLPKPTKRSVIHANEATFAQAVLESEEPVLVDFYADWCGPCKRLSPMLEEVAVESPRARVVKVNIEESPELASRYGVRSLPSLIVFKNGKELSREKGVVSKDRLHSLLDL